MGQFKCEMCKNFISGEINPTTWKCKAFPDGIPMDKIRFLDTDTCENCNNGFGYDQMSIEEQMNR